jgi:hypothetical protein
MPRLVPVQQRIHRPRSAHTGVLGLSATARILSMTAGSSGIPVSNRLPFRKSCTRQIPRMHDAPFDVALRKLLESVERGDQAQGWDDLCARRRA